MKENKINENDNRDSFMAHFTKINLFGLSNVGKSSLIKSIEKYLDKDFKIEIKEEQTKQEISSEEKGKDMSSPKITEQIKRIYLSYDQTTELFLDIYETNIDNIDFLKDHIDTLITYSECLIFMIDIASINSFGRISSALT